MNALTKFSPTKVLEGEILHNDAGDDVKVIVALNPFSGRKYEFSVPAGTSIREIEHQILDRQLVQQGYEAEFDVRIMGEMIYPELWSKVRPKPQSIVTFRGRPRGFIVPLIAGISAAFSSIGSFIGGLGFLGKILMAGISFGLKFLLNKLFAPAVPKQLPDAKTSFSISTTRNQSSPWSSVPVVLGRHRVAPFYAALPYTEMSGDDQYLRVLFVWGYGPLDITDLKIGETALTDFEDVEIQTYTGLPSDPDPTLYPNQVIEEALSIELDDTVFKTRTTAESVQEISIDLVCPNGMAVYHSDGPRPVTAILEWRYRVVGTTTWTTLPQINITAKTKDAIRKTFRQVVAVGQYEVEVRRAVAKKTRDSDVSVSEDVFWTAVRGWRPGIPITFLDPVAVTAMRIKATSQLNGALETFNGVCTSKILSWNGSAWVSGTKSSNPADLFRWVLQGPMNKNPVPDTRIDFPTIQAWANYNTASGWQFNQIRVDRSSVFEALVEICAAGRAMPLFKDGKWSVMWDELVTNVVQLFTPRNSWGFEATRVYSDLPHAYRVRFVNEDKDWVEDERIVYDDGYSSANATKFEGIEFPGVTDKDLIWKHGRYYIAGTRLRPEIYTINTDFEHIICTRGDRVRVAHDIMLVGLQSGRIKDVNVGGQTVTVDEFMELSNINSYMFRFRLADGTFLTRNVTAGTQGEIVTIPLSGVAALPAIGDLFTFGTVGNDSAIYRVLSIEPGNDLSAKIQLVDDAPAIYDADTGAIPAFKSNVSTPFNPLQVAPSDIRIQTGIYLRENVGYVAFANISWRAARQGNTVSTEVQMFKDGTWITVGHAVGAVTTFYVENLLADIYTFRVRAIYLNNTSSGWLTSVAINIGNLLAQVAPNVTGFRINSIGALSTLSWNSVGISGARYEIRFANASVVAPDWNSAISLVPVTTNLSVQVPTMVGTYFIKADSPIAAKSVSATLIYSNVLVLDGLNAIQVLTEDPAFTGARSHVNVVSSELRLSNLDAGVYLTGVYNFANSLDLGDTYVSRLTAHLEAFGEDITNVMSTWIPLSSLSFMSVLAADSWRVALEFRVSQTSGVDVVTRTGVATTYNSLGLIATVPANTPRYMYDPTNLLLPPVLMHEVGATNLLIRSEDFANAAWTDPLSSWSVVSNNAPDPMGTSTADTVSLDIGTPTTLQERDADPILERDSDPIFDRTSGASSTVIRQLVTVTNGATYTFSCWVRLVSGPAQDFTVDLGDGVAAIITPDNVMRRYSVTLVAGASDWLDIGSITAGTFEFWGAQLEAGSVATTYIPTTTVAVARGTEVIVSAAGWSDWQPFVVGDVSFRTIQFRTILTGQPNADPDILYSIVTPIVTSVEVSIDMPDRVIANNDVTIPIGGATISFTPPFRGLSGIATADQNMATGDRKAITAKSATGFTIQFFNSAGTSISRVIDWVAKGYGSLH